MCDNHVISSFSNINSNIKEDFSGALVQLYANKPLYGYRLYGYPFDYNYYNANYPFNFTYPYYPNYWNHPHYPFRSRAISRIPYF